MKIVSLLLASLGLAMAFQVSPPPTRSMTSLQMGLFDGLFQQPSGANTKHRKRISSKKNDKWIENMFKEPLHGHGSAEKELEDMYQAQQKMLEERRQLFGSSGHMRQKYRDPSVDHLRDIAVHKHDPAMLNKKEDDAMYCDDEEEGGGGFSFNPFKSKFTP